jgi:uncharacterized protein (DUF2235 family)
VHRLPTSANERHQDGTKGCADGLRGAGAAALLPPGVGTTRGERIRGGAFGFGLSRDIRDTYRFLVQNFEPGDELFFFGFSRGAFTARSTVGLIRNSGILGREHADRVDEAYALYRSRSSQTHPRSVEALFRRSYSHETRIRFIGVWDTVGALGVPLSGLRLLNLINRRWQFHHTDLSTTVDGAFQALAIDEKRGPFQPTIWAQQAHANASNSSRCGSPGFTPTSVAVIRTRPWPRSRCSGW